MIGLLSKSLREAWPSTLLFGIALLAFEILMNYILPQFEEQMADVWIQMPIVKTFMSALLGMEIDDGAISQVMQSLLWVHPIVLALPAAHAILLCTRIPAAEIDRGTIDVLLGWPVSRRQVYGAETIVWLASGAAVLLCGLIGNVAGEHIAGVESAPPISVRLLILTNMYCLYAAVGSITLMVSANSNRRGRAVLVVVMIVLVSFLINFLAQFWPAADAFAFLSVLTYYQPASIITDGGLNLRHIGTLAGVALATWAIGMEILARRSICTV